MSWCAVSVPVCYYRTKVNYTIADKKYFGENKFLFSETLKNYYNWEKQQLGIYKYKEVQQCIDTLTIDFDDKYMYFKYCVDNKEIIHKIKLGDYIVWWKNDIKSYETMNREEWLEQYWVDDGLE